MFDLRFMIRILLLAKPNEELNRHIFEAIHYLTNKGVEIVLEKKTITQLLEYPPFCKWNEESKLNLSKILIFSDQDPSIDLVITLGGDGLLLHCNTLFNNSSLPPVMCFDFGSLGFMAPFSYDDFQTEVDKVLNGSALLTMRMRLQCTIRSGENIKGANYSI